MSLGKADHRESAVSIISAEGDILSTRLITVGVSLDHLTKVVFSSHNFFFFFSFYVSGRGSSNIPISSFSRAAAPESPCTDGVGRVIAPSSVGW